MRPGISIDLTAADRSRLEAIIHNRDAAQKHVWRAEIVLLSGSFAEAEIEDLRLALAGTLRRRRRRRSSARQDAALAGKAARPAGHR
jgi:hypothetical protein